MRGEHRRNGRAARELRESSKEIEKVSFHPLSPPSFLPPQQQQDNAKHSRSYKYSYPQTYQRPS